MMAWRAKTKPFSIFELEATAAILELANRSYCFLNSFIAGNVIVQSAGVVLLKLAFDWLPKNSHCQGNGHMRNA